MHTPADAQAIGHCRLTQTCTFLHRFNHTHTHTYPNQNTHNKHMQCQSTPLTSEESIRQTHLECVWQSSQMKKWLDQLCLKSNSLRWQWLLCICCHTWDKLWKMKYHSNGHTEDFHRKYPYLLHELYNVCAFVHVCISLLSSCYHPRFEWETGGGAKTDCWLRGYTETT